MAYPDKGKIFQRGLKKWKGTATYYFVLDEKVGYSRMNYCMASLLYQIILQRLFNFKSKNFTFISYPSIEPWQIQITRS